MLIKVLTCIYDCLQRLGIRGSCGGDVVAIERTGGNDLSGEARTSSPRGGRVRFRRNSAAGPGVGERPLPLISRRELY
jgi:hypothetical protein